MSPLDGQIDHGLQPRRRQLGQVDRIDFNSPTPTSERTYKGFELGGQARRAAGRTSSVAGHSIA